MRPIDADALIADGRICGNCKDFECCDGNVAFCESARVRRAINEAPTVEYEQVKWISVKERLPENDGKYMVWCNGELDIFEFDVESQTFGYTYEDYDEIYSPFLGWSDFIHEYVTHSQPLPEPPKGE